MRIKLSCEPNGGDLILQITQKDGWPPRVEGSYDPWVLLQDILVDGEATIGISQAINPMETRLGVYPQVPERKESNESTVPTTTEP